MRNMAYEGLAKNTFEALPPEKQIEVIDFMLFIAAGSDRASKGNRDYLYKKADAAIDAIQNLKENWNGNGALPFNKNLIQKSRTFLYRLPYEPFVTPTARESIQFEYEKDNGEYLEFEIFDDRIEVYREAADGTAYDGVLNDEEGGISTLEAFYA